MRRVQYSSAPLINSVPVLKNVMLCTISRSGALHERASLSALGGPFSLLSILSQKPNTPGTGPFATQVHNPPCEVECFCGKPVKVPELHIPPIEFSQKNFFRSICFTSVEGGSRDPNLHSEAAVEPIQFGSMSWTCHGSSNEEMVEKLKRKCLLLLDFSILD